MRFCKSFAIAGVFVGVASAASATDYVLNLAAPPLALGYQDYSDPGFVTDYLYTYVIGLGPGGSIFVNQGDTITENWAFSDPIGVPPAGAAGGVQFNIPLNNTYGNPLQLYGVNYIMKLYNAGGEIATFSGFSPNHGHIDSHVSTLAPITFDSLVDVFSVTDLATPVSLNETSYNEFATFAVPEPSTWALMLVGLSAFGGALRSTRRRAAFS